MKLELEVNEINAIMQARSVPRRRARVIAANNILNALFMTVSSALAAAGFAAGSFRAGGADGACGDDGPSRRLRASSIDRFMF